MTNTTISYADGRTKETLLNGVVKTAYEYGPNLTKTYEGPASLDSPRWSCFYEDALGRTICETRPGFRGALLITSNEYNTANQLVATRTYVLNENFCARFLRLDDLIRGIICGMITLSIAIAVACGGFCAAYFVADFGLGWSIFDGILAFGVFQGVVGYLVQRRVKGDMEKVQAILMAGQKKLQKKMQQWQFRPPGSIQAAQREIAADTKVFVEKALAETEKLRKYRLWVPMMERQIATAQFQLNWMIKDFAVVDRLMPKALFLDPTMAAMKMARLYSTGADVAEIRKVYAKAVSRVKYNGNVLLAAAMSWIEVRKGDADAAFKTLTEALKKSDNETLRRNHECLMNNRVGHFSNSGIGDSWYSLFLEEPKVRMQRPRNVYR